MYETNGVKETLSTYRLDISSFVTSWYMPGKICVICHDTSIQEYVGCITIMPEYSWSIQCTKTRYVRPLDGTGRCKYICPVYGCPMSTETRAVGTGSIDMDAGDAPLDYIGRMYYYSRCIGGSRQVTGKRYD